MSKKTALFLFIVSLMIFSVSPWALAEDQETEDVDANNDSSTVEENTQEDPDLGLSCISAILLDGASGQPLYQMNAHEKCYPASTTKIMTLVLILEAVEKGQIALDDLVTVSEAAASMGGSQVYLYPTETRTVDEMLVAIAVGSGNDAAYAMAEYVGGTYEQFIDMMNQRAQELGMTNTHYVNPHGLHDPDHYTTAYDMGLLAYHASQVPLLLDYTGIYEYEFRPEPQLLVLWNTNRLLKWYEGTLGIKTGYTEEGGRSLVACTERDGMRLISVVLGSPERQGHFTDSMKLLNYGYNAYQYHPLYHSGDVIAEITVEKGEYPNVNLVCNQNIGHIALKSTNPDVTAHVELYDNLIAPVEAGVEAGTLIIFVDDEELARYPLITENAIAKGGPWRSWQKLLHAMGIY